MIDSATNTPAPYALFAKWGRIIAGATLLVIPVLFTPQVYEPFVIGKRTWIELASILLLFLWLHDRFNGCRLPDWRTGADKAVVFFLILTTCSLIWGWHDGSQFHRIRTIWLWTVFGYAIIVLLRGGMDDLRLRMWLHLPVVLVSIIALLQHFGIPFPMKFQPAGPDWRFVIISTLGNPNFVSGFLAILVPGVLIDGLYRCSTPAFILWWLPCWILILATLLVTFTMGAWIALAVAALAAVIAVVAKRGLSNPNWIRVGALLVISILVGVWAFSANPWNNFDEGGVLDAAQASPRWRGGMGGRIFNWNVAIAMIDEHPAGGIGFGNFYAVNETYGGLIRSKLGYVEPNPAHAGVDQPHQLPLELAAELGPLGAFAAWWLPCLIFGIGWRRLRKEPDKRLSLLPALLGLVVSSIHGLVSFPMHLPASAMATIWCAAVLLADRRSIQPAMKRKIWLLVPSGLVLLTLMICVSLPFFAQQVVTWQSGPPKSMGEALKFAQLAVHLNPYSDEHWDRLAAFLWKANRHQEAIEAWEISLSLVEHLQTRRNLKKAAVELSDFEKAIEHQRAMTRLNPGHIPYWEDLLFLLKTAGKPTEDVEKRLHELRKKAEEARI